MYVKTPQVKLAQLWYWPCSFFWSFYYISKTEFQGIAPKYWNHKWTKSNREGVIINMTASQAMYKKQGEILQNYRLIPPKKRDPILITPPGPFIWSLQVRCSKSRYQQQHQGSQAPSWDAISTPWCLVRPGEKTTQLTESRNEGHMIVAGKILWKFFVSCFLKSSGTGKFPVSFNSIYRAHCFTTSSLKSKSFGPKTHAKHNIR